MGYIIIFIFFFVALLTMVEQRMGKYRLPIYLLVGLSLILVAGLREVGIDPDSENYESTFLNYYHEDTSMAIEVSYLLLSRIVNIFTNDVHVLFLFYAFWGLSLKFFAFRKLSEYWFLPIVVYIAFYYNLHEVTQIRTGVLSGLYLLAIPLIAAGKRMKAFVLLLIGIFFHTSGIALLPLLFLNNKKSGKKQRLFWASLIPISYIFFFGGNALLLNFSSSIPYIGDKLALYQTGAERGLLTVSVNVFSPLQLLSIMLYFYLLLFYDTISQYNKYFPLMMKCFSIGIFFFATLSIVPVFAQRFSYLFNIVNIILYSNLVYTFKQRWIGKLIIIVLSTVLLNYGLGYIEFPFLWEV